MINNMFTNADLDDALDTHIGIHIDIDADLVVDVGVHFDNDNEIEWDMRLVLMLVLLPIC